MKLIQPSRSSFQNLIDAALRFIQWMVLGDRPHEEPIMPKNGQVGSCRMDFHAAIAVRFFHLDHISSILRHCRNLFATKKTTSEGRKGRVPAIN